MKLTGSQVQQLHDALLSAYPTHGALAQMVRFVLDENLNVIAGSGNLSETTFNLITWAEAHGCLPGLLAGAQAQNPDNAELTQVVMAINAAQSVVKQENAANEIDTQAEETISRRRGALIDPATRLTQVSRAKRSGSTKTSSHRDHFDYDVFLAYSDADIATIRLLAERLQADGLKVWFREWMIQAGDLKELKIDEGIEASRTQIFCMSVHAFDADWAIPARQTLPFRTATNQRRFVPLRLDECAIPEMIAQYEYIDWRTPNEESYTKLHRVCRPAAHNTAQASAGSASDDADQMLVEVAHPVLEPVQEGADLRSIPAQKKATPASTSSAFAQPGAAQMLLDDPLVMGFGPINALAITPDGCYIVGGSDDSTVKVWEQASGRCLATYEGHGASVLSVAVTPDGSQIISGSEDSTVKVWERASGRCLATYEGHGASVWSVAVTPDGSQIISGSEDRTVRLRRLARLLQQSSKQVFLGASSRYTNAKVVLVGESGVGKSGLALRLAADRWAETGSTHGMEVWPLRLALRQAQGPTLEPIEGEIEREVWLWDFAGQPDYRLIHQLYMDETALALLVIDPQKEDPFAPLAHWERALEMALGKQPGRSPVKLLVAARCDRGGVTVSDRYIEEYCRNRNYLHFCRTAAALDEGHGCDDLKAAIARFIPWDQLPLTATTKLFRILKETILRIKEEEMALVRVAELRQRLQLLLPDEPFTEQDLRTVIGLLAGQGLIRMLDFGDFVLLQPEQLNNYASAVVRMAREQSNEIGCLPERAVLDGNIDSRGMARLPLGDELILLRAMVQTFVERSLCLQEETAQGTLLVFPAYFRLDRPTIAEYPGIFVTYRFAGPLDEIYTTLIVRLHYTNDFAMDRLWHYAADFQTHAGRRVGLIMQKSADDQAEIQVYFEAGIPIDTKVSFIKYIHEHLRKRGQEVIRIRTYTCPECSTIISHERVRQRLERGRTTISCDLCDETFSLRDLIEEKFESDEFVRTVRQMDEQAQIRIDRKSLELILIGHASATANEAGQRFVLERDAELETDGYIELRDEAGEWSEQRIYLKLILDGPEWNDQIKWFEKLDIIQFPSTQEQWDVYGHPIFIVTRGSQGHINWCHLTVVDKQSDFDVAINSTERFTALNLEQARKRIFSSPGDESRLLRLEKMLGLRRQQ